MKFVGLAERPFRPAERTLGPGAAAVFSYREGPDGMPVGSPQGLAR